MEDKIVIDFLIQKVKRYAKGRAECVSRGTETPHLAALLLQKYGLGITDAVSLIYDNPRAADPIYRVVDEEVAKIDPQWREHMRERWERQPADISMK
jgi:hypothetical protein